MAFKPNYRFERAERDRVKRAKKEEKLKKRRDGAQPTGDAADDPGKHEQPTELPPPNYVHQWRPPGSALNGQRPEAVST